MGIDESTGGVQGSDAVHIAIGGKPRIVFPCGDSPLQGSNVWFNRFRMRSAKTRIARAANFVAYNSVTQKKFRKKTGGGAMHRVEPKPQLRFLDAFPVHEFFQRVDICLP